MVLIPVISFAAGKATIDYGLKQHWPIPYQLLGYVKLPDFIYKVPSLTSIFGPIATWENFYANLSAAIIYMLILGGILSVVTAFVYQVMGPPRWGPQDVPPPKIKAKQYKR